MNFFTFHEPPKNYKYSIVEIRKNMYRIEIMYQGKMSYNSGKECKSVWGFYNSKCNEFYAPIHYNKIGKRVNFNETTCYSAMQINRKKQ